MATSKTAVKKPAEHAKDVKLTTAQVLDAIGIEAICARVADCETLQSIANDLVMSKGSLIVWLAKFPDQYARAREAQAETLVEDLLAIADDGRNDTYTDEEGNERTNQDVIARSRLRVDARKWLAGKMAPKRYGDKQTIDLNMPELSDEQRRERLSELQAKLLSKPLPPLKN